MPVSKSERVELTYFLRAPMKQGSRMWRATTCTTARVGDNFYHDDVEQVSSPSPPLPPSPQPHAHMNAFSPLASPPAAAEPCTAGEKVRIPNSTGELPLPFTPPQASGCKMTLPCCLPHLWWLPAAGSTTFDCRCWPTTLRHPCSDGGTATCVAALLSPQPTVGPPALMAIPLSPRENPLFYLSAPSPPPPLSRQS